MHLRSLPLAALLPTTLCGLAQTPADSVAAERFNLHFQSTYIVQWKPGFAAKYSGVNSLMSEEETRTSVTSTIYIGARAWKGAELYFNPAMAGGSGLSGALGVASSTNGETFRVGDPQPQFYNARLFLRQNIALGSAMEKVDAEANALAGMRPTDRITLTAGKICMADLFDLNRYSHDPRTQFLSWGLMGNGAWDYAANVRGYTPAVAVELFKGRNEIRYALALLPKEANGASMQWNLARSRSHMAEYVRRIALKGHPGAVRLLAFHNTAPMGNYMESIADARTGEAPSIDSDRKEGRTKFGLALNMEQELAKGLGMFLRAGWNDGNNETWAFTEIDHALSGGLSLAGSAWHRTNDNMGLAFVLSGLSAPHREYLKDGGNGFMLGDGNLDYGLEKILEFDYSCAMKPGSLWFSGAYQFVMDPGYNKDRGPVSVFSLRLHVEI